MSTSFRLFVQCGLGLENLVADEIVSLGLTTRAASGGVETRGSLADLYRLCLSLRIAESVRVRLKEFQARDFNKLTKELAKLPFRAFVPAGAKVRVQVVCHKSKLWHSGAVQERCEKLLKDRAGLSISDAEKAQVIHVRLDDDQVQVSLEAAGRMHQRGYRTHVERASLRETLASALIASAAATQTSWPSGSVLWDPCCGAGTIGLEALHWARGLVPGKNRSDAFLRWRNFDQAAFDRASESEETRMAAMAPAPDLRVLMSDSSDSALEAAKKNAEKAGLSQYCEFKVGSIEEVSPEVPQSATIITNPPYGKRIEEAGAVKSLVALLKERADLSSAVVLVGGAARDAIPGQCPALLRTKNGGVPVSVRQLR